MHPTLGLGHSRTLNGAMRVAGCDEDGISSAIGDGTRFNFLNRVVFGPRIALRDPSS